MCLNRMGVTLYKDVKKLLYKHCETEYIHRNIRHNVINNTLAEYIVCYRCPDTKQNSLLLALLLNPRIPEHKQIEFIKEMKKYTAQDWRIERDAKFMMMHNKWTNLHATLRDTFEIDLDRLYSQVFDEGMWVVSDNLCGPKKKEYVYYVCHEAKCVNGCCLKTTYAQNRIKNNLSCVKDGNSYKLTQVAFNMYEYCRVESVWTNAALFRIPYAQNLELMLIMLHIDDIWVFKRDKAKKAYALWTKK